MMHFPGAGINYNLIKVTKLGIAVWKFGGA